ncbi:MAG: sensor histidine kinase [Gemmobacter sp.]
MRSLHGSRDGLQPGWLAALGTVLLVRRSRTFRVLFAGTTFGLALLVRLLLDGRLPPGFPFLTFFPAVLLTAVFAGTRAGIAVAVASGLAAWFFFVAPFRSFVLTPGSAIAMGFYALITGTELLFIAATERALRMLRQSEIRAASLARSRALMFTELQHRVSNNLATVAALLRLQQGRVGDEAARQALRTAQQRIATISRLQRRLHRPDRQEIEAGAYLGDIAADAVEAAGGDPSVLRLDVLSLPISHEQAIPLGLIVSELVMNAVEHGAATGRTEIAVRMLATGPAEEGRIALEVEDRGGGLPEGFDGAAVDSLGLSIARQFAGQLGGRLAITGRPDGESGVLARLEFTPSRSVDGPHHDGAGAADPATGG